MIKAVFLAAVSGGNRKTWHILLPTFQLGSNIQVTRDELLHMKSGNVLTKRMQQFLEELPG